MPVLFSFLSRPAALLLALALLLLAGCEQAQGVRQVLRPLTPHAQYAQALSEAGLQETELGRQWTQAGEEALTDAMSTALPYREVGYFDPADPSAVGYRLDVRRGQRLLAEVQTEAGDSLRLFIDLFRLSADSAQVPEHIAYADSASTLDVEAERDATYLLRLQPELLRGGRFTLTIQGDASLAFPVSGVHTEAIHSVFGDPRDGGRRNHHGVDIFAPRGTPVVASVDGIVTRVRDGGRGGKTVWLRDLRRGLALYYAHLDTQFVRAPLRVQKGDTLGLIGNTGNARTTPPHLHFGVYGGGPLDPYPFLHVDLPTDVTADTSRLGRWARVRSPRANLRGGPGTAFAIRQALPRHTALRVLGGSGGWYRIALPDGASGFIASNLTEPTTRPIRQVAQEADVSLRYRPTRLAAAIDSVAAGTSVPVLARFDEFVYVEAPDGRAGWMVSD